MNNNLEQVVSLTDNSHWRRTNNTVPKGISNNYLYNNSHRSDLTITFSNNNNNVSMKGHKWVLADASTTFDNAFYGNGESTSTTGKTFELKNGNELHVTDGNPILFEKFLRYMYTYDIEITFDNYSDLLRMALQYDVFSLLLIINKFLINSLSVTSICKVINVIVPLKNYRNIILKECLNFVLNDMYKIGSTEGFLSLTRNALNEILKSDFMNVSSEYHLFQYVMAWAKSECDKRQLPPTGNNKRIVLEDTIYLLRFPVMTTEEYKRCIQEEHGLLSAEEILNISGYKNMIQKDIIYLPFLTKKRLPYSNTAVRVIDLTKKGDHICACGKSFINVHGLGIHRGQYCHLKIHNQSVNIKKRRNTNSLIKYPGRSTNLKNSTNLMVNNQQNLNEFSKSSSINSMDLMNSTTVMLNNQKKGSGIRFDSGRSLSQ